MGHHPETSPTITNDPLDKVNTHLWSTLGQNRDETPFVFELPLKFLSRFPNFT
jgi:hypothetical protein